MVSKKDLEYKISCVIERVGQSLSHMEAVIDGRIERLKKEVEALEDRLDLQEITNQLTEHCFVYFEGSFGTYVEETKNEYRNSLKRKGYEFITTRPKYEIWGIRRKDVSREGDKVPQGKKKGV